MATAKFDKSKPYGICSGIDAAHYFQGGSYFDVFGVEVTESGKPAKVKKSKTPDVPVVGAPGQITARGEYKALQEDAKALGLKYIGVSKKDLIKAIRKAKA